MSLGSEVSRFVANHFIEELKNNVAFKQGDVAKALEQNFKRMDELLLTEEAHKELNEIRKNLTGGGANYGEKIGANTGTLFSLLRLYC